MIPSGMREVILELVFDLVRLLGNVDVGPKTNSSGNVKVVVFCSLSIKVVPILIADSGSIYRAAA
jgi:hypothetical protein